ncbi:WYL domain-containing protein [Clostridium weizhouense]|uniref:WYL domain-containing protein n=1 Tax=Clostridium weizhouense TaxID=2859781 RepID=A0ABS7AK72_9CLOT|nr:WYL domain-containing protein [Clostridium weizhouense]MBW6409058.1 WYL domain-containing protein [Clostridium weizhouense]
MELFHEYKNKYFHLVFRILNLAKNGLYKDEVIRLIEKEEYDEKIIGKDFKTFEGMLLNQYNKTDNFNFLEERDGKYYSILNNKDSIPIKVRFSKLEKSWLNGMTKEPVVQALLGKETLEKLEAGLAEVKAGSNQVIEFTNKGKNDFDVDLEKLSKDFYTILEGIINEKPILYSNVDKNGNEYNNQLALPIRIEYSLKDDKFRASLYSLEEKRSIMVNLHTLKEVKIAQNFNSKVKKEDVIKNLKEKKYSKIPITIELEDIRGAMERCFMSLSSFERNSRIISENKYEIDIYYYTFEEDEVIRKIMSLGPYVKVKSPSRVRDIVIDNIKKAFMFETAETIKNINKLS